MIKHPNFALDKATFILLKSFKNPIDSPPLWLSFIELFFLELLTVEKRTISLSCPWKESTVLIAISILLILNFSLNLLTCA